MKKRNCKLHIVYLCAITALTVVGIALFARMKGELGELKADRSEAEQLDREALVGSIEQAERALRTAAYSESSTLYATKMKQLAEGCASAALLTEQRDPASVWSILWTSLSDFAEREITSSVGGKTVEPDALRLGRYADLLGKLASEPEALDGPLWEEIPEALGLSELQTEFSIGEETLRERAAKLLDIGGSTLKKAESGLAGIVRYRCANAEIDLLISGELVYLDLELPRKEGDIGQLECIRRLTEFAEQEGYGRAEVTDLYENDGILWAKLAPTVELARFGAIKDLDRPLVAACTLWSGRICHFERKAAEASDLSLSDLRADALLSEKKLKKLAEAKNATLGETVICKGRLCRTLIFDRKEEDGTVCLYLDASDGSERELTLRHTALPIELPAAAEHEGAPLPIEGALLPPYEDWQRRRYRAALLETDAQ